jgi:hypothetical protein
VLFFEAAHGGKTLLDFAKQGAAGDFNHFWETLALLSGRGFSDPPRTTDSPDRVQLDDFLQSLEVAFSNSVRPLYEASGNQKAKSLAQETANGLRAVSCSACSSGKPV